MHVWRSAAVECMLFISAVKFLTSESTMPKISLTDFVNIAEALKTLLARRKAAGEF
jgi:hypothetical protein